MRSWSHDFDFFALYCRNSNVQYQGPFKVRPWISERRQSFPILSQTQNWHNWSNNSSYTTLSHARQKVSKSRTAMQCIYGDVGELWALSWQITLGTLQCTKAITWRKVKRKRASGVITRGYHCRFGTGWIFARSILANYPRELLPASAPGLLCDVKSTEL